MSAFGIDPYPLRNGKSHPKPLGELIDDYSEQLEEIRWSMERIRDFANDVVHPKKNEEIEAIPKIIPRDALSCINDLRNVITVLYESR